MLVAIYLKTSFMSHLLGVQQIDIFILSLVAKVL